MQTAHSDPIISNQSWRLLGFCKISNIFLKFASFVVSYNDIVAWLVFQRQEKHGRTM